MMSSLKYEMSTCPPLTEMKKKIHAQNKAIVRANKQGKKAPTWEGPTKGTVRQYRIHAVRYGAWCAKTYGCRHFEDCRSHIQNYADWMHAQGKSASTIHTYLAALCAIYDVPMSEITKPIRHIADNTRSRGIKFSDSRFDTQRECSPRLWDFACCVGIRRAEYAALRGSDLVYDESGYLCVLIRKGKGGKRQLQRIPLGCEQFIKQYFDGTENKVFSHAEMDNKIDLPAMRHIAAWHIYEGYALRLKQDPTYRSRLENEVKARWKHYNKRKWIPNKAQGIYHLRGKNSELAKACGIPTSFDRLAVLATSIFTLSHWRNDVTVGNYLIPGAIVDKEASDENDASLTALPGRLLRPAQ